MEGNEDKETLKDIALLQAYRESRTWFNEQIVDASLDKSDAVLEILRTDFLYQISEFYYLLSGFGIKSLEDFDSLIERHNSYLASLLKNPQKITRIGLNEQRVLKAIFDGETKPRVLKIWKDDPGTIDQSSLSRLLVSVMSDETARKVLVACEKAGFVTRTNSVFRLLLVKSNGILERIYGQSLRRVRLRVKEI